MTQEFSPPVLDVLNDLKDGDNRNLPSHRVQQKMEVSIPASDTKSESEHEERIMEEVETNLRTIIEYGNGAIATLANMAEDAENPKAYDALAKMMNSITAANNSLLNVRRKDKSPVSPQINPSSPKPEDPETGVVIKASVAEILAAMSDRGKGLNATLINGDFEDIE